MADSKPGPDPRVEDDALVSIVAASSDPPVATPAHVADELDEMGRSAVRKRLNALVDEDRLSKQRVGSGVIYWVPPHRRQTRLREHLEDHPDAGGSNEGESGPADAPEERASPAASEDDPSVGPGAGPREDGPAAENAAGSDTDEDRVEVVGEVVQSSPLFVAAPERDGEVWVGSNQEVAVGETVRVVGERQPDGQVDADAVQVLDADQGDDRDDGDRRRRRDDQGDGLGAEDDGDGDHGDPDALDPRILTVCAPENWMDEPQKAKSPERRQQVGAAALRWLRDGAEDQSARRGDFVDALYDQYPIEGQSRETWWRKTVRPVLRAATDAGIVEHPEGRHLYRWAGD